jgi:hypothetical protein
MHITHINSLQGVVGKSARLCIPRSWVRTFRQRTFVPSVPAVGNLNEGRFFSFHVTHIKFISKVLIAMLGRCKQLGGRSLLAVPGRIVLQRHRYITKLQGPFLIAQHNMNIQ